MRKLKTPLILSFVLFLSGCTEVKPPQNGEFEITSEGTSSTGKLYLNSPGGSFTSGIWILDGPLAKGEITGKEDFFGRRQLYLNLTEGKCLGHFPIEFTPSGDKISGFIGSDAHCKDLSVKFNGHWVSTNYAL